MLYTYPSYSTTPHTLPLSLSLSSSLSHKPIQPSILHYTTRHILHDATDPKMAPSSSSSPHFKPKHKPLTATTTISPSQNTTNKDTNATLSANFAHPTPSSPCQQQQQQQHQYQQQQQSHPPTTVDYDHEIYLQLVADGHKTPNQVYREVGYTYIYIDLSIKILYRYDKYIC